MDDLKCAHCGGMVKAISVQLDYMLWETALKCLICSREITLAMIENRLNFVEIKKEAEANLARITKWFREERVKRKRKKSDSDDEDF